MAISLPTAHPLVIRWRRILDRAGIDLLAVGLLVVMSLFLTHQLTYQLLTDDEESYLYQAWRVSLGELPYRDFLTPQMPVFLGLGGLVIRLAGPDALGPRLLSVGVTLLAGWLVYRLGRMLARPYLGLAAMLLYLTYPHVVEVARLYRPEAYMLTAQIAGLYCVILGLQRHSRRWLALAGVWLAIATLTKLFGALTLAGVGGYFGWQLLTRQRSVNAIVLDGLTVAGTFLVVFGGVMGVFWLIAPETYMAVLGHHLLQGSGMSRTETIGKGLAFLGDFFWAYATILVLAVVSAVYGLTQRRPDWHILAWQGPTALAFLFLSRSLYHRHMVYLAPTVCLLAVALLTPLTEWTPRRRWGILLAWAVVGSLMAPWLEDAWRDTPPDAATWRVAALMQAIVPPGAAFLTDNAGLNFYTQRPTLPHAASLSMGATASGQVTFARLIPELEAANGHWILMQTSGQGITLARMHDQDRLRDYLAQHFEAIGTIDRQQQSFILYQRKNTPVSITPQVVGPVRLTPLSLRRGPDATLDVTLAWQAPAKLTDEYLVEFALLDVPGNALATQSDKLNAIVPKPTNQWRPDELQVSRVRLPLPTALPAAAYTIQATLHTVGGARLGETSLGELYLPPP